MATVRRDRVEPARDCAYCGQPIPEDAAPVERFGERFCSERHADAFAADVRAARIEAAARHAPEEGMGAAPARRPGAYGLWIAAVASLVILGLAFFWGRGGAGGALPVGGLLLLLLVLACPLGMYFMMRGMHGGHGGGRDRRHGGSQRPPDHSGH